jgi:hypothetical protein
MTAAIFALAGTLLGILGTLVVELVRGRAEDVRFHREALRLACADFTAAVARVINLTIELRKITDAKRLDLMREAHMEARANYERLRLIAVSREAQKAGRQVLRYSYGLLLQAEGKPPRQDERERGPRLLLQDSLMKLYVEVRREIGISRAEDVYREPDEWIGLSYPGSAGETVPSSS